MNSIKTFVIYFTFFVLNVEAKVDPNFHLYLLLGQSNMCGDCNRPYDSLAALDFQETDCDTTERIKVLAFQTCSMQVSSPCKNFVLDREEGKWYTAFPPYHKCDEGVGPADYFGKVLLDSIKGNISIGFIPCALGGHSIDVFVKGSSTKPEIWAHDNIKDHAYGWMVSRCKFAQGSGVIKGILFHQGENDNGDTLWIDKVKSIFDNLKKDLNLNSNMPIIIGEPLQDTGACCTLHVPLVKKLASEYPNCGLVSSKGLKKKEIEIWPPVDAYEGWGAHFNCAGYRELGRRYAFEFLRMVDNNYIPRKRNMTLNGTKRVRPLSIINEHSWKRGFNIFTLSGRFITSVDSLASLNLWRDRFRGKLYIAYNKFMKNGKFLIIP